MRSKPARSQGGAGGTIPLLVSPQGHSACNKIYVQELDPSFPCGGPEGPELPSGGAKAVAPPGGQARLKPHASGARSVPAVVFDHVVEFNDVLPLFVFLAALKGLLLKGEKGLPFAGKTFMTR